MRFKDTAAILGIPKTTETLEHYAVMDWIETRPDIHKYTIHIANERYLNVKKHPELWAVAKKLKKMGVKKGIPDFFFACPRGGYHGMWLELKAGNNKPTKEQREFLSLMNAVGFLAVCVTGFDAAHLFIKEYFSLPQATMASADCTESTPEQPKPPPKD